MRLNKNLKFLQSTADIQSTAQNGAVSCGSDLAFCLVAELREGHRNQMLKLWFMPAKYDIKTKKTNLTVCGLNDTICWPRLFQMNMEA